MLRVDGQPTGQVTVRIKPMASVGAGMQVCAHDVPHPTTTPAGASGTATGEDTDACDPRGGHQELLEFPEQIANACPRTKSHVVCDNDGTHRHPHGAKRLAPATPSTAAPLRRCRA